MHDTTIRGATCFSEKYKKQNNKTCFTTSLASNVHRLLWKAAASTYARPTGGITIIQFKPNDDKFICGASAFGTQIKTRYVCRCRYRSGRKPVLVQDHVTSHGVLIFRSIIAAEADQLSNLSRKRRAHKNLISSI